MARLKDEELAKKLGQKIRDFRLRNRMTQPDLAKRLGWAPSMISHVESGRRMPSYDRLVQLADQLRVTIDYLLGRELEDRQVGADVDRLLKVVAKVPRRDLELLTLIAEAMAERAGKSK